MLHYSPAKQNKHQNDFEVPSELYLYTNHKIAQNPSSHLSKEIRAELDDDIYFMRRQFKRATKKLRRSLHYSNWLKSIPEEDEVNEGIRLRSWHA